MLRRDIPIRSSDMEEQKVMETLLSKKAQISLATQVCVFRFHLFFHFTVRDFKFSGEK